MRLYPWSTASSTLLCFAACRTKRRGTRPTVANQFRKSQAVDNYAQLEDTSLLFRVPAVHVLAPELFVELFTVSYPWYRNAGTNLKVGGTDPARNALKNVLVVPLHFLALKVQLVVSVSAFVMVRTVLSVSCLLFFYSRCPPCSAIWKSGGTCPQCPMESAPLDTKSSS